MQYDEHSLKIWIDGSAYHNPGKENGLAGVVQYPDAWDRPPEKIFQQGYEESNIARMELKACVLALEYVRKHQKEWRSAGVHRVQIFTDSQYVQKHAGSVPRWIKEKGRGADSQPILNMDLWRRLNSLRGSVAAEIVWHPGKTNEYNKMVDKLAKSGAKLSVRRKDYGFHPGKVARSPVGPGPVQAYPARGDSAIIKVYRYRTVDSRLKEKKVVFSVLNPTSKLLEGKYSANVRDQDVSRRGKFIAKFGNDPKYPMIEKLDEISDGDARVSSD